MYLYDAFLAWAHGVQNAVAESAELIDDGRRITDHIRGSQFQGNRRLHQTIVEIDAKPFRHWLLDVVIISDTVLGITFRVLSEFFYSYIFMYSHFMF